MKRVSGKVEALELTTDELLKRMSREQAIIFIQGILRRMEESLDGPEVPAAKIRLEKVLARKIRDFRTRKTSPMVQIRCSRGFDTKKEAFACPNIPRQSVSFFQIFLIDRWSQSLINGRAVPMAERFCSRPPSGG